MKKFQITSLFALALLFSLAFVSCSDDNNTTNPPDNTTKPYINSISPDKIYPGSELTISGKNFGDTRGNSIIKIGDKSLIEGDVNKWSSTLIIIILPADIAPGKYPVTITVDGVVSNSVEIEVLIDPENRPEITTLSKKHATIGEPIKIYGKNFGNPSTQSWVTFNGIRALKYYKWTNDMIFTEIPEGASTGDVIVYVNNIPSKGYMLEIQQQFKLLTMVEIPAGTFMMGDDNNSREYNKPAHKVTITKNYLMSITEITQKQWKIVMDNSNPSHPPDTAETMPVQQVTFQRAAEFCNRLSKMENLTPVYTINGENVIWDTTANGYRLPTEAEWEYACRAGRVEDYSLAEVLEMAWVSENSGGHTHDVAARVKNAFGLYDMLGNVDEWCWDYFDSEYYSKSPETNPRGPENSDVNHRVIRGGSFINGPDMCNSSFRNSFPGSGTNFNFNLGFRVVRNK